jgi:hypothetical protein
MTGRTPFFGSFKDHILDLGLTGDLLFVSMHERVEVWSLAGRGQQYSVQTVTNVAAPLAVAPDGRSFLATPSSGPPSGLDLNRDVLDTPRADRVQVCEQFVSFARFSADGQWFLAVGWCEGAVHVLDVRLRHIAVLRFWPRDTVGELMQDAAFGPTHLLAQAVTDARAVTDLRTQHFQHPIHKSQQLRLCFLCPPRPGSPQSSRTELLRARHRALGPECVNANDGAYPESRADLNVSMPMTVRIQSHEPSEWLPFQ